MNKEDLQYINLHVHTEMSTLDGLARIDDHKDFNGKIIMQGIASKVLELNQGACAITDHGTLSSIPLAYKSFKKKGIKLIPGIEFYFTDDRTQPKKGQFTHHLIALAKNQIGWMNILKLHSIGYDSGAAMSYDRIVPRIDMSVLREHSEGIIISSACLASVPSWLLRKGKEDEVIDHVKEMSRLFRDKETGEPGYYLELQVVDYYHLLESPKILTTDKEIIQRQADDQRDSNRLIISLAEKTQTPLTITTDAHYVNKEDRDLHQLLLAIQSKRSLTDSNRLAFEASPYLSGKELLEIATETESGYNNMPKELIEEAMQNTIKIGNRCSPPNYLEKEGFKMPHFPIKDVPDLEEFTLWKSKLSEEEKSRIAGK